MSPSLDVQGVRLLPFRLPMRLPLQTAHGTTRVREGVLVSLWDASGMQGIGESMPLPGFGLEPLECSRATLARAGEALCGASAGDLDDVLEMAHRITEDHPAARAALETALCDLQGKLRGESLAAVIGGPAAPEVEVGTLIAAKTPREVATAARRAVRNGFGTVKLKVAATTLDRDLARVQAAREAIGDEVGLRLDANGGWTEATARESLEALSPTRPEYVEQPVPAEEIEALARLRGSTSVPIAADESATRDGARRVIEQQAADFLIVKPAVLGGPRTAVQVARGARAAGIEPVVTGFLDSAVGDAAALHVAAVLGGRAAGLATQDFFEVDLAETPGPRNGKRAVPALPGLGITPDPERLARTASGPSVEVGRC